MTSLALRVEHLGKQYRIGRAQQRHDTRRDALAAGLRAPLGQLRGPSCARGLPSKAGGLVFVRRTERGFVDVTWVTRRKRQGLLPASETLRRSAPQNDGYGCSTRRAAG
jgi:hypothetical protein